MQFRISVGKLPQDTSSLRLDSNSTFENVRQGGTELSRRTRWQTNGNKFDELSGNNRPKFSETSELATRFWCVHIFCRFRWRKLVFTFKFVAIFCSPRHRLFFSVWVKNRATVKEILGRRLSVKELLEILSRGFFHGGGPQEKSFLG